jgi:hypothetical protein
VLFQPHLAMQLRVIVAELYLYPTHQCPGNRTQISNQEFVIRDQIETENFDNIHAEAHRGA